MDNDNTSFKAIKDSFLLIASEFEPIKNSLFESKLISPINFHRSLNTYLNFLSSQGCLLASKTEFLITGIK